MASVAFTSITPVADGEDVWGSHSRTRQYDCQGSASYTSGATGGYTINPATFGLQVIRSIVMSWQNLGAAYTASFYNASFTANYLQGGSLHILNGGTEISSDVTTSYYRLLVEGE